MPVSATQIALLIAIAVALGFVYYYGNRTEWYLRFDDRFLYGVPWGTLVTSVVVVGFYLLAQGGLEQWSEPLMFPFITWSYLYPTGLITAGIAHGSPAHLVSNMTGTLVLAPIVEYAWGHYPGGRRGGDDGTRTGLLSRPWVRAGLVFPLALFGVALLTSVFSFGPGLGFSGTVYALLGFAVVVAPVVTVIALIVMSVLGTFYDAFTEPIVRAAVESGTPAPPGWAGIAFQAHLLGFLIGVLLAIALLHRRSRGPSLERVFLATLVVGVAQALWLLSTPSGDDAYVLYRGAGVIFVLLLTMLTALAVAGPDRPLPRPLSVLPRAPSRRSLAIGWLGAVLFGGVLSVGGVIWAGTGPVGVSIAAIAVLTGLLVLPALPPFVPDHWFEGPISHRQTGITCLLVLGVLVALPSLPVGMLAVGGDTVPGDGGVEVGDYTVTYEQNATSGQTPVIDLGDEGLFQSEQTGVIVVSDERELWTVGIREEVLEYEGEDSLVVGGFGWYETVEAERAGWDVVGNDTAYAVDLTHDGETTRSFTAEPVRADALITGQAVEVVPGDDEFRLRILDDGEEVAAVPVPAENETAVAAGIEFRTEPTDDGARIVGETESDRFPIAERETYS